MSFSARHLAAIAALSSTAVFGAGCDLIEALNGETTTLVQLMVTHHATPQDGVFPDLADNAGHRVFDTDEGWTVTLTKAFLTTADASLEDCNGVATAFESYWGPLPEDMKSEDLDLHTFAGVEVTAGKFCGLTVEYSPYLPDEIVHEMDAEDGEKVEGTTYYFAGVAKKGDVEVPFEFSGTGTVHVDIDISGIMEGQPLTVKEDEPFPLELTLSKTYDRFFDGVDFSDLDPADIDGNVMAMLELESRVAFGTRVTAE